MYSWHLLLCHLQSAAAVASQLLGGWLRGRLTTISWPYLAVRTHALRGRRAFYCHRPCHDRNTAAGAWPQLRCCIVLVLRLQMHVHWCTPFGVLDRAGSSRMAVGACQSFLPQCWCKFIAHGLVLQQAVTHALLGAVASAVARRNFILSHCYFGVAAHLHRSAGRERDRKSVV